MDNFCIVKSHPSLLSYVDQLQKKNADALSFYPKQVFEREAQAGRILLGLLNGEPCGYLYLGAAAEDVKCHQVCIQYDARRRLYGAALVVAMEDYARERGASSLTLRCGFDLEANDFWQSMGYAVIAHKKGGIRRMRTINVWRKQLAPGLFEWEPLEPAKGQQDASFWRKHKQTGLITQFARGRRMEQYRALILGGAENEKLPRPPLLQSPSLNLHVSRIRPSCSQVGGYDAGDGRGGDEAAHGQGSVTG